VFAPYFSQVTAELASPQTGSLKQSSRPGKVLRKVAGQFTFRKPLNTLALEEAKRNVIARSPARGGATKQSHKNMVYSCRNILEWAGAQLVSASVSSPRLDAELLLEFALQTPRLELLLNPCRPVTEKEFALYEELIEKRAKRIPLQYITGEAAFRHLLLKVTPDVLIPRPETELVAEEVIRLTKRLKEPWILDIGTGSGAIALSVAYEVETALVFATDISEKALGVAGENARKYILEDRVTFVLSDLFEDLPPSLRGHIDVVVSNPPYVSMDYYPQLPPEIREHEPRVALTGNLEKDPLQYHKIIAREALQFLKPGGYLVLEIGAEPARQSYCGGQARQGCSGGHGREMAQILLQMGYTKAEIIKDLQGHDRIAKAKRT
ncbi:MAG: peptide chain release factor N(5)-glutamine methyltransferase, partial [Actinomycetota bacterium]